MTFFFYVYLTLYNVFISIFNVLNYYNIRFEIKKLSEMSEEDLGIESDDSEHELAEASEEKEDTENTEQSDQQLEHGRTARSITASKILKANLAC